MSGPALEVGPLPSRALVTGGTGYFGGMLSRYLADRGIDVVSLDRLDDPVPDPRVSYERCDLRAEPDVRSIVERSGPFDAVFHCAALMGHERPTREELWESNVDGTGILARVCADAGIRKIVYTSSICVFGREYLEPVDEDEPTCPVELYGRSKLAGEEVLRACSDRIESDSIRCPTIVSEGRLGLLAIFFEFVREGRKVYLVGDGSNRYQFIHAEDLAEACLLSARTPGTHVYHVGSDRVKTLREVYGAVIEEAGSPSRLVSLPAGPAIAALRFLHAVGVSPLGPYHSRLISGTFVFDTKRIKENLGWAPTRTNDEMLCEAYRYFERHDAARSDDVSAHRQGAKMGILRLVKWLS